MEMSPKLEAMNETFESEMASLEAKFENLTSDSRKNLMEISDIFKAMGEKMQEATGNPINQKKRKISLRFI